MWNLCFGLLSGYCSITTIKNHEGIFFCINFFFFVFWGSQQALRHFNVHLTYIHISRRRLCSHNITEFYSKRTAENIQVLTSRLRSDEPDNKNECKPVELRIKMLISKLLTVFGISVTLFISVTRWLAKVGHFRKKWKWILKSRTA